MKTTTTTHHMTMAILMFLAVSLSGALHAADVVTPDQLRDKGFKALEESQSDEAKIVEAARWLAQAADAYEKAGNEAASTELNSYLYWCKKRMTLAQTEVFAKSGGVSGKQIAAKLDAVAAQKVEVADAGKWLERADAFAAAHAKEPLLCAVRYFEVADRFAGSQESLIAQRKSLDLMGKVTVKPKGVSPNFSPVGLWEFRRGADGLMYVRTFNANHTFTTEKYPATEWASGTWELRGGKVVCRNSAKIEFALDPSDDDTMTSVVGGGGVFRRVKRK